MWFTTSLIYDLITIAEIKQDYALAQIYGKGNFRYVSNWVKEYTEALEDIYEMAGDKKDEIKLRY